MTTERDSYLQNHTNKLFRQPRMLSDKSQMRAWEIKWPERRRQEFMEHFIHSHSNQARNFHNFCVFHESYECRKFMTREVFSFIETSGDVSEEF